MRACRQVYSLFSYSHNPPPERNGQDMINFRGHGFGLLIGAKALPIHFNIQSNYTSWLDMKFQMPSQAKIIHSSVAGLMSKTCFKCHDQRIGNRPFNQGENSKRQEKTSEPHVPWRRAEARSSARWVRATQPACRRGRLEFNIYYNWRENSGNSRGSNINNGSVPQISNMITFMDIYW